MLPFRVFILNMPQNCVEWCNVDYILYTIHCIHAYSFSVPRKGIGPVFIPGFLDVKQLKMIHSPWLSASPSQVNVPLNSVKNILGGLKQCKVACLTAQHISSGHSRVYTSNLPVTGLTPMTTEPCDPHKQAHDQIPVTHNIQQESFYKNSIWKKNHTG